MQIEWKRMNGYQRKLKLKLILILISCIIFAGCSSGQGNEIAAINKQPDKQTAKIHIQFAQMSVPSAKLMEEAINRFNETNQDNIQIDLLKIPRDRYIETLNMLNASGTGPDVFEISKEWLASYINKEWVTDLSAFIDEPFFKPFPKWAVNFAKDPLYNGKFYTIPSNQITYRLIYNKDLFRKVGLNPENPPKTLAQLEKYATIISDAEKGDRKYGFALPMGEEWGGLVQPMEASNSYSGVYYYNFKAGKYDLSVYKPWLTVFKELKDNGGLFPGMAAMKDDLATAQFAEGNIGMMYAASWKLSLFADQYPTINDWGVVMPPAIDDSSAGSGAVAISAAGLNVVKQGTTHLNEAVKVWKFLYAKDYLGNLYKSGSVIPIMDGIMEDPKYTPTVNHFIEFLPGSEDSVYPNTPLDMDELTRSNAYITAISGDQPIDQVLLEENDRLNTLLNSQFVAYGKNKTDYINPRFDPQHPLNH